MGYAGWSKSHPLQNLPAFTSQPGFLHGCWGSKAQTLMFAEQAFCPVSPMNHFFRPILLFINGWTTLCCEHLPLILHPFTCWQIARLILNLGYWESTAIHMDVWRYVWFSQELYKWVLGGSVLGFWRLSVLISIVPTIIYIPWAVYKNFFPPEYSATIVSFLSDGYPE